MKIVISSGHGKYVRGASGYIDEVDEARKVVETVATMLRSAGVEATTYHDDVSKSQSENLHRITDFHNSKTRDWDISVHFNAYQTTSKPMGCEVLYVSETGFELADEMVDAICDASGLINRGPKERTDLHFLNATSEPAVLIETCFVDSQGDVDIYKKSYDLICGAIAGAIAGEDIEAPPDMPGRPERPEEPDSEVLFTASGKCSSFGGPNDTGVSPSEGLAFLYEVSDKPELFLHKQPPGTTGLARRLNPAMYYVACRWDYDVTPKTMLAGDQFALVRAGQQQRLAHPADWGPHEDTGRVADLSPGLLKALGLVTDDEVEVIYPFAAAPEVA